MGFRVRDEIVQEWKADGKQQVIAQAEMMPMAIVKRQCSRLLTRAQVIFFIDNDGVKQAMVKGVANSVACKKIFRECLVQDSKSHAMTWYSRIPSPANIAGGPSRLDFSEVESNYDVEHMEPQLDYVNWVKSGSQL